MLPKIHLSDSARSVPLPSGPQRQRFAPTPRYQPRNPFSKKATILLVALLAILVQGCAIVRTAPTATVPAQNEATAVSSKTGEEVAPHSDDADQPIQILDMVGQARRAKPVSDQSMIVPTPLALPQATIALEPTPTATQVVVDPPTFTPTPSPSATSLPPDTPTPVPMVVVDIPTETPVPEEGIKYVVIISIDGLRPDALALAHTPTLDKLIEQGAYTPTAQTIVQSCTLPGHFSMLTGMVAQKHGLLECMPYMGWPGLNGPTLFEVAHTAGLSTGMVFGKEKLNYLVVGNSVDEVYGTDAHDEEVKEQAVELIQEDMPNVLFIHFPDVDRVGHHINWMSDHQLHAVAFVDGLIGEVVAALDGGGYLDNTLLIITADHGGHGQTHGDDCPLDRTIPWLAVGPGVPEGITMGHINIYDTAATALYALDLPLPDHWDGRPVMEIFAPAKE